MMILHDNLPRMERNTSTITERGQVSIPAALRKKMGLHSGQRLRWERISDRECRVILDRGTAPDPFAALGAGPRLRGDQPRTTAAWLREIREGE